jgi:predicted RNA-binding protein (virulence factor B family)
MAEVGKINKLLVIKQVEFGMYLDGEDLGEILIPTRYIPAGCKIDDVLEVFIYLDSDDRLIATTETPFVQVGQCAHLEVVANGGFGAFMNWGLPKDLLVPFKEQRIPMQVGKSYTVFVFLDVTGRIAGTTKLSSFLKEDDDGVFVEEQMVNVQIASRSDLGYKAVINGTHLGLLHNSDILSHINVGDEMDGYIKKIREDGKIDITLQARGEGAIDSLSKDILEFLKEEGGSSTLTDKSPAELIYKTFQVSKTIYKKALGKLYKEKRVMIEKDSVTLL